MARARSVSSPGLCTGASVRGKRGKLTQLWHAVASPTEGESMALRRLAGRLREHDWFAAGIELLIVIAGILVALQVSNWNGDRQDRARARQYAQRLHGELQTDLDRSEERRVGKSVDLG